MREWFGGVVAVVVLAVLTGCASSERMTRMSGGVFEDKSTPDACRMSSAEWSVKAPGVEIRAAVGCLQRYAGQRVPGVRAHSVVLEARSGR